MAERKYADLHEHLKALEAAGLLITVERPINKDTEMHPLVRWQFLGGIPENERRAFLFTNIVDSKGRKFDIPVVIGAFAANPVNSSQRHASRSALTRSITTWPNIGGSAMFCRTVSCGNGRGIW